MVWSATRRALENKEEGGEVEEEAEEAESGERVDEVERQKREETERKRERADEKSAARRVRGRNYRGLFVAYGAQRTLVESS